jgi:chitin disaccharide deacetylase
VSAARVLIVNADDFGQAAGVNKGLIRAFDHGIVTSASMLVRWPAAREAAKYAKARPSLSVGLHLDLGEWFYDKDNWRARYEVVPTEDADAVSHEIHRQLDAFVRLVGRAPTHLDSHQHVHRTNPVKQLLADAGQRLGVPVRDVTPGVTYNGTFYGQDGRGSPIPEAITVDSLVGIIERLPAGVTELGCHPGEAVGLDTTYCAERARELDALCAPRVEATLRANGVQLRSFSDLEELAT